MTLNRKKFPRELEKFAPPYIGMITVPNEIERLFILDRPKESLKHLGKAGGNHDSQPRIQTKERQSHGL